MDMDDESRNWLLGIIGTVFSGGVAWISSRMKRLGRIEANQKIAIDLLRQILIERGIDHTLLSKTKERVDHPEDVVQIRGMLEEIRRDIDTLIEKGPDRINEKLAAILIKVDHLEMK